MTHKQNLWQSFNKPPWNYEFLVSFTPKWDLVKAYTVNTKDVFIAHTGCLPLMVNWKKNSGLIGTVNADQKGRYFCSKCKAKCHSRIVTKARLLIPTLFIGGKM